MRDLLQDLRDEGYLLAVATGKSRVGLNRALDQSRLTSLFDGTRCADETFSKPHPAMLHELTRELGQDLVAHGDGRRHDARSADGDQRGRGGHRRDLRRASGEFARARCEPKFFADSVESLGGWLRENA